MIHYKKKELFSSGGRRPPFQTLPTPHTTGNTSRLDIGADHNRQNMLHKNFKWQLWNMAHTYFLNFFVKSPFEKPPCYTETSYNFQLLICKPEAGSHAPKFNCWSSKICISNATTLVCSGNVTGIQYSEQIYRFRSNSSFLELLKLGQQVVIEHQDDKRAG